MSPEEESEQDQDSSILGRHEHWESVYTEELLHFHSRGDRGEIWFGETVLHAMVKCALRQLSASHSEVGQARVLDVGTGNGVLALELLKHGLKDVTGTDYSPASVQLAQAIAQAQGAHDVHWLVDDILDTQLTPGFDLILDKGTLDAIGLRKDAAAARARYYAAVADLLRPGGLLVITSCNSSKEELLCEFTGMTAEGMSCPATAVQKATTTNPCFSYVDHVRTYPTFRFGGQEGTHVCTVAFARA